MCGQRAETAEDQAKHLATEVSGLVILLAEVRADVLDIEAAIDAMPPRVGAVRVSLSDDLLRRGHAVFTRLARATHPVPDEIRVAEREYQRRRMARRRARDRVLSA